MYSSQSRGARSNIGQRRNDLYASLGASSGQSFNRNTTTRNNAFAGSRSTNNQSSSFYSNVNSRSNYGNDGKNSRRNNNNRNPTSSQNFNQNNLNSGDGNKSAGGNNNNDNNTEDRALKLFVGIVVFTYLFVQFFELSPKRVKEIHSNVKKTIQEYMEEIEEHEVDPGIMRLGPPYDKFCNVIMEQPVREEDISVLFFSPDSNADVIRDALTDCFDIPFTTFQSGDQYNFDLSSYGRTRGIFTTDIREVGEMWTDEYRGRMFAFFRHPFALYLDKKKEGVTDPLDNLFVRSLIGDYEMTLTFKELGIAKKIIREKCMPGLLDEFFEESFKRITDYYGWENKGGDACVDKYLKTIPHDHFGEMMHDNSEDWEYFLENNHYDLQVYEFARSVYRSGYQTMIPLYKQYALLEEDEEEEEENEE